MAKLERRLLFPLVVKAVEVGALNLFVTLGEDNDF